MKEPTKYESVHIVQVSPVLLHEVAADQRRASRPPRLAVHVHGGAYLVDELHVTKNMSIT